MNARRLAAATRSAVAPDYGCSLDTASATLSSGMQATMMAARSTAFDAW
jgi:hypothetical protein